MEETLQGTFAGVEAPVATAEKTERKEFIKGLRRDIQDKISSDPAYVERLKSLSNSLEVVNTLGAGTGGNIKLDESSSERKLVATSQIVGYVVKNVGKEPITYKTEIWAKDETGKYVATASEAVLAPGETAALTRKFMTILCARTEISFTLLNGKIISKFGKTRTVEDMLNRCYFQFNDDIAVNDDSVKISVDEEDASGRHVKPEFVSTFGYLDNPKEKSTRKGTGRKVTVQDMMANYINSQISQND